MKIIDFAIRKGLLSIFGAQIANKFIQFGTSLIIVRVLSKAAFGVWSYASTVLNMFLLFQGFGVSIAVLQFSSTSKTHLERLGILKLGLLYGTIINSFIGLLILAFGLAGSLPIPDSLFVLRSLFLIPVFVGLFESIQSYQRGTLNNRRFAQLGVFNTFVFMITAFIGGRLFQINGLVCGRYVTYGFTLVLGIYFIWNDIKEIINSDIGLPDKQFRRKFIKFAVVSSLTGSVSALLYLLDTFVIGMILKDDIVVASYRVATLIPFALSFIPSSLMMFAYPYFAKNRNNKEIIAKYVKILLKYLLLINTVIVIILLLFSTLIIKIFFGDDYLSSVVPFRILTLGYLISGSMRIPAGNILASMRFLKVNLINSVISGAVNIILDIVLIRNMGINGAAIATDLVFIVSSIIGIAFLLKYIYVRKEP